MEKGGVTKAMPHLWITYIAVLFGIAVAIAVVVVYLRMTKAGRPGARVDDRGGNNPAAKAKTRSKPPYAGDPNNPE